MFFSPVLLEYGIFLYNLSKNNLVGYKINLKDGVRDDQLTKKKSCIYNINKNNNLNKVVGMNFVIYYLQITKLLMP